MINYEYLFSINHYFVDFLIITSFEELNYFKYIFVLKKKFAHFIFFLNLQPQVCKYDATCKYLTPIYNIRTKKMRKTRNTERKGKCVSFHQTILRAFNHTKIAKAGVMAVIMLLVSLHSFAQSTITGLVIDSYDKQAVADALVTLYRKPDSTFVYSTYTNQDGTFALPLKEQYDKDLFFMEIACIGYMKQYINVDSLYKAVTLESNIHGLGEVIVTARKPTFRRKNGQFVYTPSVAERNVGNSYNLLMLTPMLRVENNIVSIIGKGESTIYINGRKPAMSREVLMDYLRTLPPDRLERIEIKPTSGVSHSAAMRNGIVNIVLKRQDDGLLGSVGAEVNYLAEKLSPRLSTNINYAKNKLQTGVVFGFYQGNQQSQQSTDYFFKSDQSRRKSEFQNVSKQNSFSTIFNLSYDLTPKSLIGISASVALRQSKNETVWNNLHTFATNQSTMTTKETERIPADYPTYSARIFYDLKTDEKGSDLEISAGFSNLKNTTNSTGNRYNATISDLYQQNIAIKNYGLNGQAKYNYLLNDDNNFTAGYEVSHSNLSNDYAYLKNIKGQYVIDTNVSNHFVYDETVNAGFVQYSRQWNDVFSTIAGIRVEHTDIEGRQKTTGEKYRNSYTNVFPQLGLEFDLADGTHNIAFDYSKSLSRPFFDDLNPFKIWQSELSYTKGNMYLRPSISNSFELIYTLMSDYSLGFFYEHESDTYGAYSLPMSNDIVEQSVANYGHDDIFTAYVSMNKTFFKNLWRLNASAEYNYAKSSGKVDATDVSYKDSRWAFQLRNMITLSRKQALNIRLNYSYSSPIRSLTRIGYAKHFLSFALTKTFKNGSSLDFYLSNILNYKANGYFENAQYKYTQENQLNQVMLQLQYTYIFGNKKLRRVKDHSTDNNLNRFRK